MTILSSKDCKRFYLKFILHKMKGATCFNDLLTVNITVNLLQRTYEKADLALGLIDNDEHIYKIFEKACKIMLPHQLSQFSYAFFWQKIVREMLHGKIYIYVYIYNIEAVILIILKHILKHSIYLYRSFNRNFAGSPHRPPGTPNFDSSLKKNFL